MSTQQQIRKLINHFLKLLGLTIVQTGNYFENLNELGRVQKLRFDESRNGFLIEFLGKVANNEQTINNLSNSQSQLYQDLFVLNQLSWKENGYFVEFGATDGVSLSNTYLLEKKFNWSGILAEPGRNWHQSLQKNRSCKISKHCVWGESGVEVQFLESEFPEFSTIQEFLNFDGMARSRKVASTYLVRTVSLEELLDQSHAPKHIDYISIDTEGSELEILRSFSFDKYSFGVLTVEHNNSKNEDAIDSLLASNGYIRVHRDVSQFDGWYTSKSLKTSNLND